MDRHKPYITRCGIYRGPKLSIFRIDPTTGSDAIDRKPDTGVENVTKNAVFWWFNLKLMVLTLRYRFEILIRVVWSSNSTFTKISSKMNGTKLVI